MTITQRSLAVRRALDSGSLPVLLTRVAAHAVGVAVIVFLLAVHGREDTGIFVLVLTVTQIAAMPIGAGFGRTLTRVVGRGRTADAVKTWRLGAISCVVSSVIAAVGGAAILAGSVSFEFVAAVVVPGTISLAMLQLEAAARRGAGRPVATTVIESLIPQLASMFALIVGSNGLETILGVRSMALVVAMLFVVRPNFGGSGRDASRGLTLSSVYSAAVAATQLLLLRSDLLIIGWLIGPAAVAPYAIVQRFAEVVHWPVGAHLVGTGRDFARPENNDELREVVIAGREKMLSAQHQAALVGCVMFAAALVVAFRDIELAAAFGVLVVAALVLVRYGPEMSLLIMRDETGMVACIGAVGLGVNLLLTYVLVGLIGTVGAAAGTFVSVVVMYASLREVAIKKLGISVSR
jgi:O-antigen/teichoic acid export membrane protein